MAEGGGVRSPVTLSDGVVVLRRGRGDDASWLAEAATDPEVVRWNGPAPGSPAEAAAVIDGIERRWRAFDGGGAPTGVAFAVVEAGSGRTVGMCGVDEWSDTGVAQFGYWLAAGARGRGLATRAVRLMTAWLLGLGAARVVLTIQTANEPSAAVARRAGFVHEATLRAHGVREGRRVDVDVFAVVADGWPPAAAP